MSTFKGIIKEFPQIRIDYFRQQPDHEAPLACFLSHVHSDHLVGLESLRAPFVYCSAATREILLRLEKFHYRINFAKGILESRNVTYDRSMRRLAKPLPLDTPTTIELGPERSIRVTLIDANHCVGAVMFLIEDQHTAVLYTGDIRAETWWVNSLMRNPILLPYTLPSRHLDCIYLDTTFASKSKPYRDFPSKAEGICELLEQVALYPTHTKFYFHSWTFGYEDVWIALSNFLGSGIHMDDYRAGLYASLSALSRQELRDGGLEVRTDNKTLRQGGLSIPDSSALCGFRNGNHVQPGCLTSRTDARIHSCERGMGCHVVDGDRDASLIHIIPIVTRVDGVEIAELGAGGGKGDLDQREELSTDDVMDVRKLIELCRSTIKEPTTLSSVVRLLQQTLDEGCGTIDIDLEHKESQTATDDALSLRGLVRSLASKAHAAGEDAAPVNKTIRFPYSRHSSYNELCILLDAFRPKDVFPCTVDELRWDPSKSMKSLFGAYCSEDIFRHDLEMMQLYHGRIAREAGDDGSQTSQPHTQTEPMSVDKLASQLDGVVSPVVGPWFTPDDSLPITARSSLEAAGVLETHSARPDGFSQPSFAPAIQFSRVPKARCDAKSESMMALHDPSHSPFPLVSPIAPESADMSAPQISAIMQAETHRKHSRLWDRSMAHDAALGKGLSWDDFGGLVSAKRGRDCLDEELS